MAGIWSAMVEKSTTWSTRELVIASSTRGGQPTSLLDLEDETYKTM
jgi:hypothetical protein